jgi:molecular chaperone GrpE (heat shock protein)
MPKHESELNVIDKGEVESEPTPGQTAEVDSAAPEAETVPAAGPPETGVTVSQAEYEQVKAERDHLKDRLARLQAEFDNARKRAEREKRQSFATMPREMLSNSFFPSWTILNWHSKRRVLRTSYAPAWS